MGLKKRFKRTGKGIETAPLHTGKFSSPITPITIDEKNKHQNIK